MINLPNPLAMSDGRPVSTPEMWTEERRLELLELFRTYIYGCSPEISSDAMGFETKSITYGMLDGRATRKLVTVKFQGPKGNGKIDFVIFLPSDAKTPVPGFLHICIGKEFDLTSDVQSPYWPVDAIVSRGYAAIAFHVAQVDPDNYDGFKDGVHGIFDTERKPDSWGTIAAWAWGASRVMDYLVTDPDIDAGRIAVIGHSRGGKTALWCGAEDQRFALVISNNSGCTGAAIAREKKGEKIADINRVFPHWFCDNYKKFNGKEDELPVDHHELLALMAPRPVYVASATLDDWADPENEFLACVKAEPVYKLLGMKGLGTDQVPRPEEPLQDGAIGYHLRTGQHALALYDWNCYMDFADKYMR